MADRRGTAGEGEAVRAATERILGRLRDSAEPGELIGAWATRHPIEVEALAGALPGPSSRGAFVSGISSTAVTSRGCGVHAGAVAAGFGVNGRRIG